MKYSSSSYTLPSIKPADIIWHKSLSPFLGPVTISIVGYHAVKKVNAPIHFSAGSQLLENPSGVVYLEDLLT